MVKWGIIADDFTGLQAVAARFADQGYAVVTTTLGNSRPLRDLDVVGIDTASRWLSSQEAFQRVGDAARCLNELGVTHVFKQNDSTLTGNLGAELEALRAVYRTQVLFCAACPSDGRLTVDGMQFLHGMLQRPHAPGSDNELVTVGDWIGHASRLSVRQLGMRPYTATDPVALMSETNDNVLTADAICDEQLRSLVTTGFAAGFRLWGGSVGLASAVAAVSGASAARAPTLLVAGSLRERTAVQVHDLLLRRPVVALDIDPGRNDDDDQVTLLGDRLRLALEAGSDCLVTLTAVLDYRSRRATNGDSEFLHDTSRQGISLLARVVSSALQVSMPLAGLVLTGGDTAAAIIRNALGATSFRVEGELFPAGVVAVPQDGWLPGCPIVTKSGNWGPDDALVRARDHLAARRERRRSHGA